MTEGLFVDAGFDTIHSRALHICWWLSNVLFSCGPSCWGKLYTAEMICRWFGLEIVLEINFGHRPFWQIAQMPTILKNFYFCCLSLHSQKIMFCMIVTSCRKVCQCRELCRNIYSCYFCLIAILPLFTYLIAVLDDHSNQILHLKDGVAIVYVHSSIM